MRTKLSFELVCSVCQSTLEADTEEKRDTVNRISSIKCGSAFECKATMAIRPCAKCARDHEAPITQIKEALGLK